MTEITNMPERPGNLNNNPSGKWAYRSCTPVADAVCNKKEQTTGRPIKVQCQMPQTSSNQGEAVIEKNSTHSNIKYLYYSNLVLTIRKSPGKFL